MYRLQRSSLSSGGSGVKGENTGAVEVYDSNIGCTTNPETERKNCFYNTARNQMTADKESPKS